MKIKFYFVLISIFIVSGCMQIITFDVEIEKAEITSKRASYLTPKGSIFYHPEYEGIIKKYIRFDISSEIEIDSYYREKQRPIQIRCKAECFFCNSYMNTYAQGPFYKDFNISYSYPTEPKIEKDGDNKYKYSIYAFSGLELSGGPHNVEPVPKLRLQYDEFEYVSCYIVGPSYLGIWPRSNNIRMTSEEFQEIYRSYKNDKNL